MLARYFGGPRGGAFGLGLGDIEVGVAPRIGGPPPDGQPDNRPFGAIVAEDKDKTIFANEIGVTFRSTIAENTIKAFEKPGEALKAFKAAEKKESDAAADEYKRYFTELTAMNVPKETAMQIAKDNATDYFNRRMEVVKIQHPYADSAEKLINLAKGVARRDVLAPPPNNAGGGAGNQ